MVWFARTGLRVLMYHKVSLKRGDALTVTCEQLAAQLDWLQRRRFAFISGAELVAALRDGGGLPPNPVLVTFDDGYMSTWEQAYPMLAARRIPGVVFVPTALVGATSAWDVHPEPLLQPAHLRELEAAGWDIGLHSHRHLNYAEIRPEEIAGDLAAATAALRQLCARPLPALAYPYGRRLTERSPKERLDAMLRGAGLVAAFRIGNRINALPPVDAFDLNRIGPRGDRGLAFFQRQILWGRWW